MQAGRELDARVAERVMGWAWQPYRWYDGSMRHVLWHDSFGTPSGDDFGYIGSDANRLIPWEMPAYSTDISAAWQVVESLAEVTCDLSIEKAGLNWHVNFGAVGATAQQVELAICLAALEVMGIKIS